MNGNIILLFIGRTETAPTWPHVGLASCARMEGLGRGHRVRAGLHVHAEGLFGMGTPLFSTLDNIRNEILHVIILDICL